MYFTVLHILSVIADKTTILHFMVIESEFRSVFSKHFSVDMTSIFAYNEGGRWASSYRCDWHLKSESDTGLWPGRWRATEKPERDAGCKDLSVGGQQKNQSFKKGDEWRCGVAVSLFLLQRIERHTHGTLHKERCHTDRNRMRKAIQGATGQPLPTVPLHGQARQGHRHRVHLRHQ